MVVPGADEGDQDSKVKINGKAVKAYDNRK